MLYWTTIFCLTGAVLSASVPVSYDAPVFDVTPKVNLKNGSYYGSHNVQYNQDHFLGMPFAQPPLEDLRFNNPQSLNTTWSGYHNATQYSPECYGYGSDDWVLGNDVSEDCLTINVVRPSGYGAGDNLPVGVWIYGGGGYEGGSLDPRYNLSFITQQAAIVGKPIITVSLNYRLQAFGFIWGTAVKDAGVSNLAYKDQRLALHWLQENIAAFGGDPSKVVIWGESAGASSVAQQLLAFGGRNDSLFRGAIQESGGFVSGGPYITAEAWDPYYNNITNAVNCSNASDTLACLRQVPIDTLSAALNSSVTAGITWQTQIDGNFIVDSGTKQLLAGNFVQVPLLHGRNHDEGAMFATKGINTTEQFLAAIIASGANSTSAAIIAALYPDIPVIGIPGTETGRPPAAQESLGVQWKREAAYAGDSRQHAPRRLTSQTYAQLGIPSWTYLFNVLVNGLTPTTGATHFQEVAFVFDNIMGLGYGNVAAADPFANTPLSYKQLAYLMTHYWIGFIHDLDPNSNNVTDIYWPSYNTTILDDDTPYNIVFNANKSSLAYAEPDLYRVPGIQYLQDLFVPLGR